MDDLAKYNKARWEELAKANVEFSQPFLNLDPDSARKIVDQNGLIGDVTGKRVLCLASGGGQQSAAFALLGAKVTVVDLADAQLERDKEAAAHYNLNVTTIQGDMRDLSAFADHTFDIVWQAYSINFVPDPRPVFREVARVLQVDGLYRIEFHNPFTSAVDDEAWNGSSYPLQHPYIDGAEVSKFFPHWDVYAADGTHQKIGSPREFRHNLSTMLNGIVNLEFVLLNVDETTSDESEPEPGSWEHFKLVAPPFLTFWFGYYPQLLSKAGLP